MYGALLGTYILFVRLFVRAQEQNTFVTCAHDTCTSMYSFHKRTIVCIVRTHTLDMKCHTKSVYTCTNDVRVLLLSGCTYAASAIAAGLTARSPFLPGANKVCTVWGIMITRIGNVFVCHVPCRA